MDYLKIEFLGILLNVTGICLWGITLLYFMRNRAKNNQEVFEESRGGNKKPFDEEMFAQMVKQQSERSFKRISAVIMKERQLLWAFIERGELKKAKNILLRSDSYGLKKMPLQKDAEKPYVKAKPEDKYAEVVKLADLGMTTKKISEKVNIPKGEIELLVKLRKKGRGVSNGHSVSVKAFS